MELAIMTEETFVIWNDEQGGFLESTGKKGVFYTKDIDSAFQFKELAQALEAVEGYDNCAVLKWI